MHIAYISHEYPPDTGRGGIGTYTMQIAGIMSDFGHDVEIFTASFHRNISEKKNTVLIHRIKINQINDFKTLVPEKFAQQHKSKLFNIIECPEIGSEAEIIKQQFPEIPLVVRLHTPAVLITRLQNTFLPLHKKLRFVAGALIRGRIDLGYWSRYDKNQYKDPDYLITEKASVITAPSQAMKKWTVDFWRINPQKIKIVPNPYIPSLEILKIPFNRETKIITFLGRLTILKGATVFTKALPEILKNHKDWKVIFIGKNEASHIFGKTMQQWISEYLKDYAHRITFIGSLPYEELKNYLLKTSIMVIPSFFESFSYVCVEAMSAACAVIGSKKGGMAEIITHGKDGLLINPKSAKQIGKNIELLIENTELRQNIAQNAREKILREYNGQKIGSQMLEIYQNYL